MVVFGADITDLQKKLKTVEKDLKKANKELANSAKAWSKLTAPIAAFGVAAVASFQKVETALNKIRVGTGATGKALKGLQADFRKVAASSTSSLGSVATVLADLNTKLSLTGEPLQKLTTQITNLAKLTGADGAALTGGIAKAFNLAKVSAEEYEATLDRLFTVEQNTGVSVTNLTNAFSQFAPILSKLGMNINSASAFIGNLEKSGISANTVMSALQTGLTKLAKNGVTNTGTEMVKLIDAIKNTTSETERMNIANKLFGSNAEIMITAIKNGSFELDNLTKSLYQNTNSINQTAKDTETLSDKWTKLTNSFTVNGSAIGKSLNELASSVLDKLTGSFKGMSDEAADTAVKFGIVVSAIGPIKMALSGLTGIVLSIVTAFKGMATALLAGKSALEVFSAALGGLPALLTVVAGVLISKYVSSLQEAAKETARLKKITDDTKASLMSMNAEQKRYGLTQLSNEREKINARMKELRGLIKAEESRAIDTTTDDAFMMDFGKRSDTVRKYREELEKLGKQRAANVLQSNAYQESIAADAKRAATPTPTVTPTTPSIQSDTNAVNKFLSGKSGSGSGNDAERKAKEAARKAKEELKKEIEADKAVISGLRDLYSEEDWNFEHGFSDTSTRLDELKNRLQEIEELKGKVFQGDTNDLRKDTISKIQSYGETEADKLAQSFEAGKISASELQEKAKALTDQFAAMNIPVGNTLKTMADGTYTAKMAMEELRQASIQALGQLKSGLIDAIVEGGNLADTLNNVGKMLIKIALNSMLSKPFQNLTSWIGGIFGHHSGGVVGIDPASFRRSIPKFHSGGIVGANEQLSVLQKGEAVFTREQQKALGGLIHKDSTVKDITINITNNGSGNMSNEQAQTLAKQIKAYVKTEVADEMYTYNRNKMYAMG